MGRRRSGKYSHVKESTRHTIEAYNRPQRRPARGILATDVNFVAVRATDDDVMEVTGELHGIPVMLDIRNQQTERMIRERAPGVLRALHEMQNDARVRSLQEIEPHWSVALNQFDSVDDIERHSAIHQTFRSAYGVPPEQNQTITPEEVKTFWEKSEVQFLDSPRTVEQLQKEDQEVSGVRVFVDPEEQERYRVQSALARLSPGARALLGYVERALVEGEDAIRRERELYIEALDKQFEGCVPTRILTTLTAGTFRVMPESVITKPEGEDE